MSVRLAGLADADYLRWVMSYPVVADGLAKAVENPVLPTAEQVLDQNLVFIADYVDGFIALQPIAPTLGTPAYEIHVCFMPGQGARVDIAVLETARWMFMHTPAEVITAKVAFVAQRRDRILALAARTGFVTRCEDDEYTHLTLSLEDWALRNPESLKGECPGGYDGKPLKTRLFHTMWRVMRTLAENGMPEKGVRMFRTMSVLLGRNPVMEVESLDPLTVRLDGVTISLRGEPCPS